MCIRGRELFACAIVLIAMGRAMAQPVGIVNMMPNQPGGNGQVNLPYLTPDGSGGMWFVYVDGSIRQQTGQPVYAQGGMLTIDGNQFNAMNNQGTVTNGELILRNAQMGGVSVTRRIFFDKQNNYVRFVDVLQNNSAQDVTDNVMLQSTFNWGVQQAKEIADPKHKDRNLAWSGMTAMGRAVLEVFGGSGGKLPPMITYQNGGNVVQATFNLTIPAKKEVALMHLHLFVQSLDAGSQFVAKLNNDKLIHSLPADVRKSLINFSAQQDWLSDLAILRGDVFDVVELRGGDAIKGTLAAPSYKLRTFFGPVELAAEHVVSMINIGQSHPRQLLVTDDGEIFGGELEASDVQIALTSGQWVKIPLEQVSRVGFRKRASEPEEWTFDRPMALLREGDRVVVDPPGDKINFATRYGTLELDAATLAAIQFQPEESGVHQAELTDGSRIAGLVSDEQITMKLSGVGPSQIVDFPVSRMQRLQLTAHPPEADAQGPVLTLSNQDVLCGSLEGQLSLQTSFDTINIDGSQIRHIGRNGSDLQIALWDGSVISGQTAQSSAQCHLLCGPMLNVPLGLVTDYEQPNPLPSAEMVKQIQAAAADLSADDWRKRDQAEAALTTMGPAVIGVLLEVRPTAPVETQQRIDGIVKKLKPGANKPAEMNSPQQ